nr:S41 family peptidase [uncultured Pedobacter sp.]
MGNYRYLKYILLIILISSIAACRKSSFNDDEKNESPTEGTREQLTLDSIYLYTKHTYLWNNVLPDYKTFNPRKYNTATSDLLNFRKALYDISQYKINTLTSEAYEKTNLPGLSKYSYIEEGMLIAGFQAALNTNTSITVSALSSGNIGYLKLSEFAHLSELTEPLNEAFTEFASSGITSLVIDLRNNPGGYVETAQYLANLIATPPMNDKVMYSEHFNTQMQSGKATILKNQLYLDENNQPVLVDGRRATYADVDFSVGGNTYLFKKAGQLKTISSLYFLVNNGTASASEMLINSLKPYFNVKLIGEQTYGKPVGSFGIKIDRMVLSAVSFQIKNAKDEGDYFSGMSVEIAATDEQLGNESELIFVNALSLINKQQAKVAKTAVARVKSIVNLSSNKAGFTKPEMIKERLRLKR